VDDQATVVASVDDSRRDAEGLPLKAEEPRAFTTLLRSGLFVRHQRTDGVERCLTEQHSLDVSHMLVLV